VDRGDVGVLFVDLLFALVVVELLEPLRNPADVLAAGGVQLVLAFILTLLSWIGYHLSVSRLDGPVRIDSPSFIHLLSDVLMVALYWLTAVSYERAVDGRPLDHSWWIFPNPSPVPEAMFVAGAFALYVVWDRLSGYIHTTWADKVNAELEQARFAKLAGASDVRRARYSEPQRRWPDEEIARWKSRNRPTNRCFLITVGVLAVAVLVQEAGPWASTAERWTIGIDVALIGVVVSFRTWKEWRAYRTRLARWLTIACWSLAVAALAVPAIDSI
jgi:hypothetical protein